MPADISWYLEGRILYIGSEGEITTGDLYQIHEIATQLMQSSPGVVHIINDHSQLTQFPRGIGAVRDLVSSVKPANRGWIMNISSNSAGRMVAMLVAQLFGLNVRSSSSVEEALRYLRHVDHSLEALI